MPVEGEDAPIIYSHRRKYAPAVEQACQCRLYLCFAGINDTVIVIDEPVQLAVYGLAAQHFQEVVGKTGRAVLFIDKDM